MRDAPHSDVPISSTWHSDRYCAYWVIGRGISVDHEVARVGGECADRFQYLSAGAVLTGIDVDGLGGIFCDTRVGSGGGLGGEASACDEDDTESDGPQHRQCSKG